MMRVREVGKGLGTKVSLDLALSEEWEELFRLRKKKICCSRLTGRIPAT